MGDPRFLVRKVSVPEKKVLEAYFYYRRLVPAQPLSYRLIGKRAGVSERVVPDYLRRLEKRGLIKFGNAKKQAIERAEVTQ